MSHMWNNNVVVCVTNNMEKPKMSLTFCVIYGNGIYLHMKGLGQEWNTAHKVQISRPNTQKEFLRISMINQKKE